MAKSIRHRILEAFVTRLQAINGAPPFTTSAGNGPIYLGFMPRLGDADPPEGLIVIPEDDEITSDQANLALVLPLTVGAIAKASLDRPWDRLEELLADIKRSIELADRTLGLANVRDRIRRGPTRTFEREAGSTEVALGIQYRVPYVEGWGTP